MIKSCITLLGAGISVLFFSMALAAGEARPLIITFDQHEYLHRWSKHGQYEFTPKGQEDLSKWQEMVTINVHDTVKNGDELANLANGVLGNYQRSGKILRVDSKPQTTVSAAEHLIVAILGAPGVVEAAFARVVLIDDTGVIAVYSRRAYGEEAAMSIGAWLQANGASAEKALMQWDAIPSLPTLRALPQHQ
ncbi:hypothetical protein [Zobellella sp. DQSA1]|uniref:hypothetical protein n=1 Tax=Zobellella sp. DQSA1 TaxID=3342386 RepID=UPI0035C0A4AC